MNITLPHHSFVLFITLLLLTSSNISIHSQSQQDKNFQEKKLIFVDVLDAKDNIDKNEKIAIENGLMNHLLTLNNKDDLGFLFYDSENMQESAKRMILNTQLGSNESFSDLQLRYNFRIKGKLLQKIEGGKMELYLEMTDGENLSKKIRSTKASFYEFQSAYYLEELAKSLVLPNYKINENDAPQIPDVKISYQKVKVENVELNLKKINFQLQSYDSAFINEIQNFIRDGEEYSEKKDFLNAAKIYKLIEVSVDENIGSSRYSASDKKSLANLKRLSIDKKRNSYLGYFSESYSEFTEFFNEKVNPDSQEDLISALKMLREINKNQNDMDIKFPDMVNRFERNHDIIMTRILYLEESKIDKDYNNLKFISSIDKYNELKNTIKIYDNKQKQSILSRLDKKIELARNAQLDRLRNNLNQNLKDARDLAGIYKIRKRKYEMIKDSRESFSNIDKFKKQSLQILDNTREEMIASKQTESQELYNIYNQADREIKSLFDMPPNPLKQYQVREKEKVDKKNEDYRQWQYTKRDIWRSTNLVLPGFYNITVAKEYERTKKNLLAPALFWIGAAGSAYSVSEFNKAKSDYNSQNQLYLLYFANYGTNILPGTFFNNATASAKSQADSYAGSLNFFAALTVIGYIWTNYDLFNDSYIPGMSQLKGSETGSTVKFGQRIIDDSDTLRSFRTGFDAFYYFQIQQRF